MTPRITFLVTYPRDVDPQREAIAQDIAALAEQTQAQVLHIAPPERLRPIFPERLFGMWLLPQLRRLSQTTDVFHVWHGHPRFFSLFNLLNTRCTPVVYSVVSGLRPHHPPAQAQRFNTLARLLVSNDRDARQLSAWNIHNQAVIRAGIRVERFIKTPPPPVGPGQPFRLLMGSAPWSLAGFQHKGIDGLLDAMTQLPNLQVAFLWRGFVYDEMMARIRSRHLQDRAQVLNEKADVNAQLERAHAAILTVDDASTVKAYPNSLMEAVVSGRPVIVSQPIPMSDDVTANGYGVVVPDVAPRTLVAAIQELMTHYPRYQQAADAYPAQAFSRERWQQAHLALYQALIQPANPAPAG